MRYGAYAPQNFNLGYEGNVTARKALQQSLNLPAIELLADVGPATFLARLHGAGAEIQLPKDTPVGLAIGLGGLGVSLTDLARLYAGFARGGEAPALVERLGGPPVIGPRRVTDPVAAFYVDDILRGAPPPANALKGRIAFKTGTSYGFRDALAIGFDRGTTIAVWVGRPDNGPTPGLIGREAAAPILFDAFARIGLGLKEGAPDARLALKALGGAPPFTWFVNGEPVGEADLRRQSAWKPDGAGFARVSVTDAKGASDVVTVRLE